ncbi:MAG: hypothetical protein WCY10_05965 [Candidatus Omnitrophota bacterium]
MKRILKCEGNSWIKGLFFLLFMALVSNSAYAYQPRAVFSAKHPFSNPVVIINPEVSKIYYGQLTGDADYYRIDSRRHYQLYLNIMVPDRKISRLDMTVDVIADNKALLRLKGKGYIWERFFDPLARDRYLKGPDLDWRLRQGTYYIKVYNKGNLGKYSLSVGVREPFSPLETLKTAFILPGIKARFFNKPAYCAFLSPFGLILLAYLSVAGVFVFWIRRILRQYVIR